jgi:RNA polymerase sigma-70 factor (ECF subfamily)
MDLLVTGLQKSNLPACPPEGRASVLEKDTVEPWLYHEIEALIPRLTKYARALTHDVVDADDLVQESLSRALAKLHLWRRGTNLRAWLFTIMHHQYVNERRRASREKKVALEDHDQALAAQQDKHLEFRDLARAMGTLSTNQRSVIMLVGVDQMEYEEAALVLNLPLGTVRSRLARGRNTLRQLTDRLAA